MPRSKINFILIVSLLFAASVQLFGQTAAPAAQQVDKLIAVIKSDASHKEKADACRQLTLIGAKDAVAPLAALLGDEKLSHMARYALEPIPDPAVDDALRDALGRLEGRPLVGVIGSIGVRRDAEAVEALAKMLRDGDADVAQAAARAMGKIGTAAAGEALLAALKDTPAANLPALCEGLFRCAEALAGDDHRDKAVAIYDSLLSLRAPRQIRAGALRGAILVRGEDGLSLLREYLRSDDYVLFSAAVQAAQGLPGAGVTSVLTSGLGRLPADNQVLVIHTLAERADTAALPALFTAAKSGPESVRLAAIGALPQLPHPSTAPVLVQLLRDADRRISRAAQDSLGALPGRMTRGYILEMLNSGDTGQRLTAIELIGRQRIVQSVAELLKAAGGTDARVRQAALKMAGELGRPADVPQVLELLMRFTESQDLAAAEQAVTALCTKADNPQSHTAVLIDLLARAQPPQKNTLLRVLGILGGTDALKAVREALGDSNSEVYDTAVRVLCAWRTADAAPDLLNLAGTSGNPAQKTAALRGYISLVRDESLSAGQKLAMCKRAAELIERDQEKKLLLGVLGLVPTAEALSMAMAHLNNPATKDEAGFAAVAISEKIVEQNPAEVADALRKVIQATGNGDIISRAKAVLDRAKKAGG